MRKPGPVWWLALVCLCMAPLVQAAPTLHWQAWHDDIFKQAQRENRFVLLNLEAVWCHWCHVMDAKTYSHPKVIRLLNQHFIAVTVDQNARPDLANRYDDYGWPATIVYNSNGGEIVIRSGYLPPELMISMLKAILKDPSPGPSVPPPVVIDYADHSQLPAGLRKRLLKTHVQTYDFQLGSWGTVHKFMDWRAVEYSLLRARHGNLRARLMARQTLLAQLQLIDPVWGGVYQYSSGGDWQHPHFEKIMPMQAGNLTVYALAWAQWHEPTHRLAAEVIARYLHDFLTSPQGAFYTSQDADLTHAVHASAYFELGDTQRRQRGMPRIDQHIYARENGWAIAALAQLYAVTGANHYLHYATDAARWIMQHRRLGTARFQHGKKDTLAGYLGDTLAMGNACLSLYGVTAQRSWLKCAEDAAARIARDFPNPSGTGYLTALPAVAQPFTPQPLRSENVALARYANLLYHYTGNETYARMAQQAMRYLVTPEVASQPPTAAVLLAAWETSHPPVHLTIVGKHSDAQASALFQTAISYPSAYRRVEWWDPAQSALPNRDITYPSFKRSAAYLCTERSCSSPAFTTATLRALMAKAQASHTAH